MVYNIKIKHTIDNKIFKSHNSSRFEIAKKKYGESTTIFIKSDQYSHKNHFTSDNMGIQHVFMLCKILFPFVSIIWAIVINSR
jgi:hypothetical protein